MDNIKNNPVIQKINKKLNIQKALSFLYLAFFGCVVIFMDNLILLVVFLILALATSFAAKKLRKNISDDGMELVYSDPELCEEYMISVNSYTIDDLILTSISKGALKKAVKYSDSLLQDKNIKEYPKYEYTILSLKMQCCFMMEDIESLLEYSKYFEIKDEDTAEQKREKSRTLQMNSFYKNFAEKNYSVCVNLCHTVISQPKIERVRSLRWKYYLAVTYYKMGEFAKAKEYFSKVAEMYPKTSFAKYSLRYIDAIDNGYEYKYESIFESEDEEVSDVKTLPVKKNTALKKILEAAVIVVFIVLIIVALFIKH